MKDQPEEEAKRPATDCSVRGGTAHNPGLDRLGEGAECRGVDHPGRGQEEATWPPGQEHPEDQGAKKKHAP